MYPEDEGKKDKRQDSEEDLLRAWVNGPSSAQPDCNDATPATATTTTFLDDDDEEEGGLNQMKKRKLSSLTPQTSQGGGSVFTLKEKLASYRNNLKRRKIGEDETTSDNTTTTTPQQPPPQNTKKDKGKEKVRDEEEDEAPIDEQQPQYGRDNNSNSNNDSFNDFDDFGGVELDVYRPLDSSSSNHREDNEVVDINYVNEEKGVQEMMADGNEEGEQQRGEEEDDASIVWNTQTLEEMFPLPSADVHNTNNHDTLPQPPANDPASRLSFLDGEDLSDIPPPPSLPSPGHLLQPNANKKSSAIAPPQPPSPFAVQKSQSPQPQPRSAPLPPKRFPIIATTTTTTATPVQQPSSPARPSPEPKKPDEPPKPKQLSLGTKAQQLQQTQQPTFKVPSTTTSAPNITQQHQQVSQTAQKSLQQPPQPTAAPLLNRVSLSKGAPPRASKLSLSLSKKRSPSTNAEGGESAAPPATEQEKTTPAPISQPPQQEKTLPPPVSQPVQQPQMRKGLSLSSKRDTAPAKQQPPAPQKQPQPPLPSSSSESRVPSSISMDVFEDSPPLEDEKVETEDKDMRDEGDPGGSLDELMSSQGYEEKPIERQDKPLRRLKKGSELQQPQKKPLKPKDPTPQKKRIEKEPKRRGNKQLLSLLDDEARYLSSLLSLSPPLSFSLSLRLTIIYLSLKKMR